MVGRRWHRVVVVALLPTLLAGCRSGADDDVADTAPAAVDGTGSESTAAPAATGVTTEEALATDASVLAITTGARVQGTSSDPSSTDTKSSDDADGEDTTSGSDSSVERAPSTSTSAGATSRTSQTSQATVRATTTSSSAKRSQSSATTSTTAGPSDPGSCRAGTTHCVGPGQAYGSLTQAVAAAGDGAVIELLAGRYNETVAVAADNVTIRSQPSNRATIDCGGMRPAQGKACVLAVGTNLTVENLIVTGARGPDNNEACFRNEPGTRFIVRGVECHGSNNGILGSGGSWLIEDSYFHGNGAGDGLSHNLYLSGNCSEVVFRRSRSENAIGGHAFKSRCRTSTIESSELSDNTVADAAEFSNGGAVTIRSSTVRQPDGANGNIVRHGAEGCRHSGTLTFVASTIVSARTPGYIRSECGPVTLTNTPLPTGVEVVDQT